MNPEIYQSIVELVKAEGASVPSASNPEYSAEADDESVTVLRNVIDGGWLCSVSRATGHLHGKAAQEALERLLRLTADSRFGSQLIGSIGPDGEAVVTTTPAAAHLGDAGKLGGALEAASAWLAQAVAPVESASVADREAAWTRV